VPSAGDKQLEDEEEGGRMGVTAKADHHYFKIPIPVVWISGEFA